MKAPAKKAPNTDKPKVPLKAKPITNAKSENERLRDAMDQTRAAVHANKLPEQPPADNEHVAEGAEKFPESNLGDWDQNGKAGGDAKALGKEIRPMPKDFKPTITVEGSRIVARQDGIEVPFINTEDKAFYAQQAEQQRKTLWRELERKRIRGLDAK